MKKSQPVKNPPWLPYKYKIRECSCVKFAFFLPGYYWNHLWWPPSNHPLTPPLHAPLILVSVSWVDTFLTIVTPHASTVGQLGRFDWEKRTEGGHAHWRYSLHTLASVRVLVWFSSTQKEFCITLWYNIVDHRWSVAKMMLVYYCTLASGRRNQRLGYAEWDLSWKTRPMDTQSTNKKRPHTNTDYLPVWVMPKVLRFLRHIFWSPPVKFNF
jgi:hypothetical protein